MAYRHTPAGLAKSTRYRVDTASGAATPATITTANDGAAITGAVLATDIQGRAPAFLSASQTLYLKELGPADAATGSPVTSTGVQTGALNTPGTQGASPTFRGTLQMYSDGTGGTSTNPTSDTTGHIVIPSYQTNSSVSALSPGEGIRMQVMNGIAKNMIAWQMPRPLATGDPSTLKSTVWIGAHYFDQNDGTTVHGHWSLEVPDSTDSLRTRFEVKICDASGNFLDKTIVQTSSADLVVDASNSQVLRIRSGAGAARFMEWANDQWGTSPRWRMGVPSDAGETGSNAGSDFAITRFSDASAAQDSPFTITRANGKVNVGGANGTAAGLQVNRASAGNAVSVNTNIAGATGATAYNHNALEATSRTVQANITTDSNFRLVIFADGKFEWGAGVTTRDVNLYRKAADQLGTDDALFMANLTQPGTPTGGGVLFVNGGALKYIGSSGTVTTLAPA